MNAADLKSIRLFTEFGDDDREAVFELLEERSLAKGRRVFSVGEEADSMLLLLEGRVRLEGSDGRIEGSMLEGDALGGLSLVRLGQRAATAICETPCRLVWLDRSGYRRLADDHPRTACRLVEAILETFATDVHEAIEDAEI